MRNTSLTLYPIGRSYTYEQIPKPPQPPGQPSNPANGLESRNGDRATDGSGTCQGHSDRKGHTMTENTQTAIDRIKEATGYLDTTDKEEFSLHYQALAAIKKWDEATERQAKITAARPGYVYEWSLLNELVEADVAIKFWDSVIAASSPSREDLRITREGLAEMMTRAASALLRNQLAGTSSDAMSNAKDAIERQFFSRLLTWSSDLREVTLGEVL